MIELNKIHKGHVLNILKQIDAATVDCIVTSPPYYGLRSYKTEAQIWGGKKDCQHEWGKEYLGDTRPIGAGLEKWQYGQTKSKHIKISQGRLCIHCNTWKGELGSEPTFELFLQHLWMIFDEVYRVLKPGGSCWVNLGDTYNGSGQESGKQNQEKAQAIGNREVGVGQTHQTYDSSIKKKSLLQIPSRFAIGMTDRGWILRNEIIWYKRNCMPTSAKDRFTVDFEKIFFFTKQGKYFFDQQFETLSESVLNDYRYKQPELNTAETKERDDATGPQNGGGILTSNALGRNKRCVWDITPTPFPEAHFAVYPQELVEPMIKSGCPEEICNKCGKPKEKIYESFIEGTKRNEKGRYAQNNDKLVNSWLSNTDIHGTRMSKITGFTDCKCNAGYHPGIVLDPFIGSGTTGIVARKLNRNYIGIELQEKYIEIAEKRIDQELGFFK